MLTRTRPSTHTLEISPYGSPMTVVVEYEPGEAPIYWPTERAHPGCPPECHFVQLLIEGEDHSEMVECNKDLRKRIEDEALSKLEESTHG